MMTCERCHWAYPDELLVVMNHGKRETTPPICAICALEMINETLPQQPVRARFDGEQAEAMRQEALAWRHDHPQHGKAR